MANRLYTVESIGSIFDKYRGQGKKDSDIYNAFSKQYAGNTDQINILDQYMKQGQKTSAPIVSPGPAVATNNPVYKEGVDYSVSKQTQPNIPKTKVTSTAVNAITAPPAESSANRTNTELKNPLSADAASGVSDVEKALDDKTNKLYTSQQQSNARTQKYENDAAAKEQARIDAARAKLESDTGVVKSKLEEADSYMKGSHTANSELFAKKLAAKKDALRTKLAAQGVTQDRIESIINEQLDQSEGNLAEQKGLGDTYQGNLRKSAESFQNFLNNYQTNTRNLNADEKSVVEAVKDSLISGENKLEGIKQTGITDKTQPLITTLNKILEKKQGNISSEIDRKDTENEFARSNASQRKNFIYQKLFDSKAGVDDIRGSLTDDEWSQIVNAPTYADAIVKAEQFMYKHKGTTTPTIGGLASSTSATTTQSSIAEQMIKQDPNKFNGTWTPEADGSVTHTWKDGTKMTFWKNSAGKIEYAYKGLDGKMSKGAVDKKNESTITKTVDLDGAPTTGITDADINAIVNKDKAKFSNGKWETNKDGSRTFVFFKQDGKTPTGTKLTFAKGPSGNLGYKFFDGSKESAFTDISSKITPATTANPTGLQAIVNTSGILIGSKDAIKDVKATQGFLASQNIANAVKANPNLVLDGLTSDKLITNMAKDIGRKIPGFKNLAPLEARKLYKDIVTSLKSGGDIEAVLKQHPNLGTIPDEITKVKLPQGGIMNSIKELGALIKASPKFAKALPYLQLGGKIASGIGLVMGLIDIAKTTDWSKMELRPEVMNAQGLNLSDDPLTAGLQGLALGLDKTLGDILPDTLYNGSAQEITSLSEAPITGAGSTMPLSK